MDHKKSKNSKENISVREDSSSIPWILTNTLSTTVQHPKKADVLLKRTLLDTAIVSSEIPRLKFFKTRITESLGPEILFIQTWSKIVGRMVGGRRGEVEIPDPIRNPGFYIGLQHLIEENIVHLQERTYYRTDDNWILTHPKKIPFLAEVNRKEDFKRLWATNFSALIDKIRQRHLARVRDGDHELAERLLMHDGTWLHKEQFTRFLQELWANGPSMDKVQKREQTKKLSYWFRLAKPRKQPERDRLEDAARAHAVALLIRDLSKTLLGLAGDISQDADIFDLPEDKDEAFEKYIQGLDELKSVAKAVRALLKEPVGEAFEKSAPFRLLPKPAKSRNNTE